MVKIVNSSDSKYLEHIDLLKKLSYDSIIKYFDDFSLQSDPKSRYIVFEYCEVTCLKYHFDKNSTFDLTI